MRVSWNHKLLAVCLFLVCQTGASIAPAAEAEAAPPARPNIVVLLADDMGYGDPGCYNSDSKIPTPAMNGLARQGMRFTDAHSPSSVCTPTRYGLLTGRYCWRSRLKDLVLWGFDHPLIEPDRETAASYLKRQGYATACVGKWHLGLGWSTKDGNRGPWPDRSLNEPHDAGWGIDYQQPLSGGPNVLGFDFFYGIAASNNMPPYCFIRNERVVGNPSVKKTPLHYGNRPAPMVPGWDDSQYGPSFTEEAVGFLKRHHAEHPKQPFFLYFPSQAPHRPCVPPDFVQGKSRAGRRGDMVVEFDWSVQQVLSTLRELGVEQNTLVLVTSDNGGTPGDTYPLEEKKRNGNIFGETYGHLSCGKWRGYKSQIWEGGHRVPLLVRWPGKVQAGTVCDVPVCLADLPATFAAILGQPLPEGAAEDSLSLLPLLQGKTTDTLTGRHIVLHDVFGRFAIRQGDWKYVAPAGERKFGPDPGELLYHLQTDPGETKNVLAEHPEVAARLKQLLQEEQRVQD